MDIALIIAITVVLACDLMWVPQVSLLFDPHTIAHSLFFKQKRIWYRRAGSVLFKMEGADSRSEDSLDKITAL